MNVHAIDTRKSNHISVQGSMQSQTDRDEFLLLLKPGNHKEIELTFFDARILPAEVMMAVKSFMASNKAIKLKINVFHRYLGSYFFRLGIPCHVMQQHSLEYRETKKIKAIALGGSAGSLDKIMSIMAKLPPRDISVFIVQHILEKEPNYLGEIVVWSGWALATWSLPGLAFAVWTIANLAPRARSHHTWYQETFPDYPAERKALVPWMW